MCPEKTADATSSEEVTGHVSVDVWRPATHGNRANAYLIILNGSAGIGRTYKLTHRTVIGRTQEAEIRLEDEGVSRRHAELALVNGDVELRDLGSRNGTYVNGDRIDRRVLADGDKIQVGSTAILKFSYQDELEEALQNNLYEAATRDPLTQAHNRRFLLENLAKEFAYAARHGTRLSVVMIDLDWFKRINDEHGHVAGDHVLRHVCQLIRRELRREDVLARYGGEEFVVLLRDVTHGNAIKCSERIRRAIERESLVVDDRVVPATCSIGVATYQDSQLASADELLKLADQRLYRAKEAGRNRVIGD